MIIILNLVPPDSHRGNQGTGLFYDNLLPIEAGQPPTLPGNSRGTGVSIVSGIFYQGSQNLLKLW